MRRALTETLLLLDVMNEEAPFGTSAILACMVVLALVVFGSLR